MSVYSEFFFNSATGVRELELIQLSHPSFSKTYYLVRNQPPAGLTVTLEDAAVQHFDYYPMEITPTGANTDLDQTMQISFGDLGQLLPQELDRLQNDDTFKVKPILLYRSYRSDVLTSPMTGPIKFDVLSIAFIKTGVTLNVAAPRLNLNKTGEAYNLDRFPALRVT
jgi:hypothetical protein